MSASFLCLYTVDRYGECPSCGGSATLGGTHEPFEDERGVKYCSSECAEEAFEFAERAKSEAASRPCVACRSCGLDNYEHTDDCARAAELLNERGTAPWGGGC